MELTEEMLRRPLALDKSNTVTYDIRMLMKESFGVLDYDVKLGNGMNLQRDFCWTLKQKQELVLSMLKEIAIPALYIYKYHDEDDNVTFKIIDGKQRISTLISFAKNEFPIIVDGNEYYFDNLHRFLKSRIVGKPIPSVTFWGYYDDPISDKELVEIFHYVNFTGTPQDENHMNELLTAIY